MLNGFIRKVVLLDDLFQHVSVILRMQPHDAGHVAGSEPQIAVGLFVDPVDRPFSCPFINVVFQVKYQMQTV
ncbi:hypothetical protein D3C87_2021670 [compost metagenome]